MTIFADENMDKIFKTDFFLQLIDNSIKYHRVNFLWHLHKRKNVKLNPHRRNNLEIKTTLNSFLRNK